MIKTKYIDGPLKDLDTTWKFISLKKKKTKIIFMVEFEFKKYIHQKLAEFFFPLIENSFCSINNVSQTLPLKKQ